MSGREVRERGKQKGCKGNGWRHGTRPGFGKSRSPCPYPIFNEKSRPVHKLEESRNADLVASGSDPPMCWLEHSNSWFESIRFDSLCESIRIDSFCKKSAFRFTSCHAVFLAYLLSLAIFFTRRVGNKSVLIWLLTTQPHLKHVATLSCNLSLILIVFNGLFCWC